MARLLGPLLVAIAAMLWATDTVFRLPTVNQLGPVTIVFFEHLIALLVLLPWLIFKYGKRALQLGWKQWTAAAFIGIGGSAVATILFTGAFRFVNPSVVILLQKTQPLLVVFLAYVLLREKPGKGFFGWAALAILAAIVLMFPDFNFSFLKGGVDLHSRGIVYALGAAALWAVSTVAGKILLQGVSPALATFWRYAFGIAALAAMLGVAGDPVQWSIVSSPQVLKSLAYMALVPGLLAMVAYYSGMIRTTATITTFCELLFPVGAVAINTYWLKLPLSTVQLGAGAVLVVAVTALSWQKS